MLPRPTINRLSAAISALLVFAACHRVPSDVIQPEEMAQLMADVHVGEAVVEMNRNQYQSDSSKQAFKQSVYAAHGVDAVAVDSSMAWYGRHITRYMDVYDRTIEILEHRLIETGNRVAAEAALSMAGDSVDVWPHPRYMSFGSLSPSATITFAFASDDNWEAGDTYTWRAKFIENGAASDWAIAAQYSDGTVETVHTRFGNNGWRELVFRSDSTRNITRLSGYLTADIAEGNTVRLDSMQLVRKRLDAERYSQRYMQRTVRNYEAPSDSL